MAEQTAIITLRAITKETLHSILNLAVAEHQKHFVAPNAVSIAQAYFEPEEDRRCPFLLIYL